MDRVGGDLVPVFSVHSGGGRGGTGHFYLIHLQFRGSTSVMCNSGEHICTHVFLSQSSPLAVFGRSTLPSARWDGQASGTGVYLNHRHVCRLYYPPCRASEIRAHHEGPVSGHHGGPAPGQHEGPAPGHQAAERMSGLQSGTALQILDQTC